MIWTLSTEEWFVEKYEKENITIPANAQFLKNVYVYYCINLFFIYVICVRRYTPSYIYVHTNHNCIGFFFSLFTSLELCLIFINIICDGKTILWKWTFCFGLSYVHRTQHIFLWKSVCTQKYCVYFFLCSFFSLGGKGKWAGARQMKRIKEMVKKRNEHKSLWYENLLLAWAMSTAGVTRL